MSAASTAPIPETMDGLRRQNSAYRSLCANLELQLATQTDFARRCHEAETTLDSEREANALLTEQVERLEAALEWALDNATDSEHPHYPERILPRTAYAVWQYPYLISGTPLGGGVGHANFPSALEAVEAARLEKRS
jgi:hypothetical protein